MNSRNRNLDRGFRFSVAEMGTAEWMGFVCRSEEMVIRFVEYAGSVVVIWRWKRPLAFGLWVL